MENVKQAISHTVFALLVSCGDAIRLGEIARKRCDAKLSGAYDTIMQAAYEAGDWPTFEAASKELFDGIRTNVVLPEAPKGLAVLFGAEKGQDKDGNEKENYTIPDSLRRAKTVVKKAFENGVSLTDENGNRRSFNSVKEENKKIAQDKRDAAEAKAVAEKIAGLTGEDLLRAEIEQCLSLILERANKATGGELAEIHKVVMVLSGMAEAPESQGTELASAAA